MVGLGRGGTGWLALVTALMATAAVGAAAPAGAQAPPAAASGWPQFQGNAAHTGDEPAETSVTAANARHLAVAWTAPLPATSYNSEVTVAGGVTYVAAGATVTAFDASDGTQLWQASLPGESVGMPSVADGLVLEGVSEAVGLRFAGFVEALNSATGTMVWIRQVGTLGQGATTGTQTITTTAHRAYITLLDRRVVALDIPHGVKKWLSPVLAGCAAAESEPSAAGRFVVVGGGGTDVTALNAANGTVAWHDTLGTGCGRSAENWLPAVSNGTVYAGLLKGMAALDLPTGAVKWQTHGVDNVFFPLALTAGDVIAGTGRLDQFSALSRADGTPVWRSALPDSGGVSSAAVFGGLAWALELAPGSAETVRAVALDRLTGHQVFASASYADPWQGFPPVVAAGHVFIDLSSELLCLALPGSAAHHNFSRRSERAPGRGRA